MYKANKKLVINISLATLLLLTVLLYFFWPLLNKVFWGSPEVKVRLPLPVVIKTSKNPIPFLTWDVPQTKDGLPEQAGRIVVHHPESYWSSAWNDFCVRYPAECRFRPEERDRITLTLDLWNKINKINRKVNAEVIYASDKDNYAAEEEYLDLPFHGYGDCEDYALLKRHYLLQMGISMKTLRLAMLIGEREIGHVVLIIRTDRGDFVLDSNSEQIAPWGMTRKRYDYTFIQGSNERGWLSLKDAYEDCERCSNAYINMIDKESSRTSSEAR